MQVSEGIDFSDDNARMVVSLSSFRFLPLFCFLIPWFERRGSIKMFFFFQSSNFAYSVILKACMFVVFVNDLPIYLPH